MVILSARVNQELSKDDLSVATILLTQIGLRYAKTVDLQDRTKRKVKES